LMKLADSCFDPANANESKVKLTKSTFIATV